MVRGLWVALLDSSPLVRLFVWMLSLVPASIAVISPLSIAPKILLYVVFLIPPLVLAYFLDSTKSQPDEEGTGVEDDRIAYEP